MKMKRSVPLFHSINEEVARIQAEESHSSRVNPQEIPQEIPQEKSIEDRIIEAMIERPEITRNELALKLDLKPEAIKYRLSILKKAGRIEHQGSTKAACESLTRKREGLFSALRRKKIEIMS